MDAGTKIYCNRVDAVHQEVVKLAESCILAEERGTKEKQNDDDSSAEEEGMEVDDSEKDPKRGREHRLKVINLNKIAIVVFIQNNTGMNLYNSFYAKSHK